MKIVEEDTDDHGVTVWIINLVYFRSLTFKISIQSYPYILLFHEFKKKFLRISVSDL